MCGDQNLWRLNSCGDQNYVAIKILWRPNSCGDRILEVTKFIWQPKMCGDQNLWQLKGVLLRQGLQQSKRV
jgi:hypothetical protein